MVKRPSVTEQARRLTKGQINRRRFIMSAVASGVTLPTATALATKAEARIPERGGTLRIASARNAETFLAHATGNTLTRRTSEGRVVGELATQVSASEDHRWWSFALRDDVRFHDGTPMTGNIVAEALNLTGLIDGHADATGDHSVTFRLRNSSPNFPALLADRAFVVRDSASGTTTGAYIHERTTHNLFALSRNPHYWRRGAAHFDAVEIINAEHSGLRHRALMSGLVDYADEIDPQALATFKSLPNIEVLETRGTHHLAFPMRRTVPPFDDPQVRAALANAIDASDILRAVALGYGQAIPLPQSAVPKGPTRLSVALAVSDDAVPGSAVAAHILRDQAKEHGIDIIVTNHTLEGWPDAKSNAGWYVTNGRGNPDPDAIPALRLNALAAHTSRLSHPAALSTDVENDAYRIAERWWFNTKL